MIDEVFARLGVAITIKLNNRKVLAGIAEMIGRPDKLIDITVAIDKLDKIGLDNVKAELIERSLTPAEVERLMPVLSISGSTSEKLDALAKALAGVETGLKGIEELRTVTTLASSLRCDLELDFSLARGLNYYTGTIVEVKARDVEIGSISGGGRYDNLTGVFGMPGVSGVGVSFGADRIYDVLNALNLYPADLLSSTRVLFVNFGDELAPAVIGALSKVRAAGIPAEIYPDAAKMKKQMKYADDLRIPFVAIIGESEAAEGKLTLKDMNSGEQKIVTVDEAIEILK